MILLVRHAVAVSRAAWRGRDQDRPLTERGERQAAMLVGRLAPYEPESVVSSPSLRCVATVGGLAEQLGVAVETSGRLREGKGNHALDLVLDAVGNLVVCTHGDVIEHVLARLNYLGWRVPPDPECAKGSTWAITAKGPCTYLPPP